MARIDLSENEYMERFVDQSHIDSNDVQFWYQLLSCSFNFMRVQEPKVVDKTLKPYLVRLALNNPESLNIGSLVRVALDRISRIKSQDGQTTNPYYIFQSFNALYLLRCICKSYIENTSEEKLVQSFRAKLDVAVQQQTTQTPVESNLYPQSPMPPRQLNQQQQPSLPPPTPSSSLPPPLAPQHHQPIPSPQFPHSQQEPHQQVLPQQFEDPHVLTNRPTTTAEPIQTINSGSQVVGAPKTDDITAQNTVQYPDDSQASKKAEVTSGSVMLDQFISTLIAIIVDIPLSDSTYLLQVEAINALLVLLSVQMYTKTTTEQSYIYKSLMQKRCSIHALILTKTLLNNFVRQQPVPQESGSIIIGLASGLWRVLTLGYGVQDDEESDSMPLLAKQSLSLLNVLTNHYTNEKNPYREAIVSCQDSRYNLSDPQLAIDNANNDALASAVTSKSALVSNSIKIEFRELYATICKNLHVDQVALLLYILLHSNKMFRPYILTTASSELSNLVLPLLKILYSSIERGSHHVYMVLIIFIILSEETSFNLAIHKLTTRGVPWYKDRVLSEISLGSLTALIVIRSIQYNTFRIRDKFLHTNLFATLANLSNHFHHLHPYVCQRLVDLIERLSKRYLMLTKPNDSKPINSLQQQQPRQIDVLYSDNSLAKALATDTYKQDLHDVSSIELDSTSISQNGGSSHAVNINIPTNPQLPINEYGANNNVVLPPVDMHGNEYLSRDNSNNSGQPSPNSSNANADHVNIAIDESRQDLGHLEEVIRMILEVINNSLIGELESNPDLIYTLLYKRTVFNSLLSSHKSFYNMVINVERILTFFYNKIEAFQKPLAVDEIKELIRNSSKEWTFNQQNTNNPSSRLLFHYVEDEQPEEFFIPYIWTMIYYSSGIVWEPKQITLFNPEEV